MRTYILTQHEFAHQFEGATTVIVHLRSMTRLLPREVAYIDFADELIKSCCSPWLPGSSLERQIFLHPSIPMELRRTIHERVGLYNDRLHPMGGRLYFYCDDIELYETCELQ